MIDPEEILKATKKNISAVEDQINVILASLVKDKLLDRDDLNTLVGKPSNGSSKGKPATTQGPGGKRARITATQKPLSVVPSLDKPLAVPVTLREDDFFLIPCLDKWVVGATFTNVSDTSLSLPSLLLTTIADDRVAKSIGPKSIEYDYKIMLVNSNSSSMEPKSDVLPIQERWHGSCECVRPGCSFKVLVHFAYPGSLVNQSVDIHLHITMIGDENNIWNKIVDMRSYWQQESLEEKFQKSRVDVYLAMTKKSVTVVLESKSSTPISKRFMVFIENQLHLTQADAAHTKFDTKVVTYLTERLDMLWGLVLEIIICKSNSNRVICVINARTIEQFNCIMDNVNRWVQMESSKDPTLACTLGDDENPEKVLAFLQNDIKTMMQLVYLHETKMLDSTALSGVRSGSRTVHNLNTDDRKTSTTAKWMRTYVQSMQETDNYFMKKQ